jgi:hypothetical protein
MAVNLTKRARFLDSAFRTMLSGEWKVYIGCFIVFALSFTATIALPVGAITKAVLAFPGAAALLPIIYKLWREEVAHERAIQLQELKDASAFATASHMAKLAYDKHAKFCEEYLEVVNDFLPKLWWQSGPGASAKEFALKLSSVRARYSAWLTQDIESGLYPIESNLLGIGARSQVIQSMPVGENRSRMIDEIYDAFGLVTDSLPTGESDKDKAAGAAAITEHIRTLLGIQNLTELRLKSAQLALRRMNETLQ